MSIQFSCPKCDTQFNVDEANAGRKAKCKRCGTLTTIPSIIIEELTREGHGVSVSEQVSGLLDRGEYDKGFSIIQNYVERNPNDESVLSVLHRAKTCVTAQQDLTFLENFISNNQLSNAYAVISKIKIPNSETALFGRLEILRMKLESVDYDVWKDVVPIKRRRDSSKPKNTSDSRSTSSGPSSDGWHIENKGKRSGPYSTSELGRQLENGLIMPWNLVWKQGMSECVAISEIDEFRPYSRNSVPKRRSATSSITESIGKTIDAIVRAIIILFCLGGVAVLIVLMMSYENQSTPKSTPANNSYNASNQQATAAQNPLEQELYKLLAQNVAERTAKVLEESSYAIQRYGFGGGVLGVVNEYEVVSNDNDTIIMDIRITYKFKRTTTSEEWSQISFLSSSGEISKDDQEFMGRLVGYPEKFVKTGRAVFQKRLGEWKFVGGA